MHVRLCRLVAGFFYFVRSYDTKTKQKVYSSQKTHPFFPCREKEIEFRSPRPKPNYSQTQQLHSQDMPKMTHAPKTTSQKDIDELIDLIARLIAEKHYRSQVLAAAEQANPAGN